MFLSLQSVSVHFHLLRLLKGCTCGVSHLCLDVLLHGSQDLVLFLSLICGFFVGEGLSDHALLSYQNSVAVSHLAQELAKLGFFRNIANRRKMLIFLEVLFGVHLP